MRSNNFNLLLKQFADQYPEWASDARVMAAVRAALQLCEATHPGWISCDWCHGLGYVNDHNYGGTCPLCGGKKGRWNRRVETAHAGRDGGAS